MLQGRHDDRDPARARCARTGSRENCRFLLLRNERPHADDLRVFARRRRRRSCPPTSRRGSSRKIRSRASTSTAWASSSRSATRRGREANPGLKVGHLRRARWRPALDRVLSRRRPRLRVVLAVPRAGRAPGGGAGGARLRSSGSLVDGIARAADKSVACFFSCRLLAVSRIASRLRPTSSSCRRRSGPEIPRGPTPRRSPSRGGRIAAVGSNAEIEPCGARDARPRREGAAGRSRLHRLRTRTCRMGGFDLLAMDLRRTKDEAEFTGRSAITRRRVRRACG